jgi:DNA-binding response OmpR family regulator
MRILISTRGGRRRETAAGLQALGGFEVQRSSSISQLGSVRRQPDAILIECDQLDEAVVDYCARLRTIAATPILVAALKPDLRALRSAYVVGINDFLIDPFSTEELAARLMNAVQPRFLVLPSKRHGSRIEYGPLVIAQDSRTVSVHGERVELRPMEYTLLVLLARRAGQVLAKEQLIVGLWPDGPDGERDLEHALEVHIGSLRRKLAVPHLIATVRGIGYRLISQESYWRLNPDTLPSADGPTG